MSQPSEPSAFARLLLHQTDSGILATMSTELPGYPFGSVTPFVMTHDGKIVIYISAIAQHTANLEGDCRCCLTVMQPRTDQDNQQSKARVTVVGDARRIAESSVAPVAARYFRFFPESRSYGQTHDFSFYALEPVRIRYIGGFGKIFWVEPEEHALPAPEWQGAEDSIRDHMLDEHGESLRDMARHFFGVESSEVELVAIDVEGCHIRTESGVRYLPFDAKCTTMEQVRSAMVRLARASAVA